MSKIATIADWVGKQEFETRAEFRAAIPGAVKRAAKRNVHFDLFGRAYVPEKLRGKGVGYNGKRVANRSDKRA